MEYIFQRKIYQQGLETRQRNDFTTDIYGWADLIWAEKSGRKCQKIIPDTISQSVLHTLGTVAVGFLCAQVRSSRN